ncbi:AbiTii domain-containing protein [Paenibacillus sp. Z3-2]
MSIILEIQKEALDPSIPVSVLLRKFYTISRKLHLSEHEKWANLEMNGYNLDGSVLPEYRMVHGEIKAKNPAIGYIPAYLSQGLEILSQRKIYSPLTQIEDQIKLGESDNGILVYNFPTEIQKVVMKATGHDYQTSLHFPITELQKIVAKVRNIILEWTIQLEENGVLGEGMTFNNKEREQASKSGDIIINTIGTMYNSQIQQKAVNSSQELTLSTEVISHELSSILKDIKKLYEELQEQDTKEELKADIESLEAQLKSPKPKNGIIKEGLKSVRNIAEGVTGSLIATALQGNITSFINKIGG